MFITVLRASAMINRSSTIQGGNAASRFDDLPRNIRRALHPEIENIVFAVLIRRHEMKASLHYYVLSLNSHASRLYEGFRDQLIDIQNMGFPYHFPIEYRDQLLSDIPEAQLRTSLIATDQRFDEYYAQEPLRLIIIGAHRSVTIFQSLTVHRGTTIGILEGDFTSTSPIDLGKIVWPVLMEAIAGNVENVRSELDIAAAAHKLVSGINAVALTADFKSSSTLFVEEDYREKVNMIPAGRLLLGRQYDELLELFDDVVDILIERVLEVGGRVKFMKGGSIKLYGRIALILGG
jgi:hypothetical protein